MRARERENGSGHFHRSICVTYIKFPLAHACACTSSGLLLSCSCSSAPWNIRTPPCPTPSFDKNPTLNPKPSLEPSFAHPAMSHNVFCKITQFPLSPHTHHLPASLVPIQTPCPFTPSASLLVNEERILILIQSLFQTSSSSIRPCLAPMASNTAFPPSLPPLPSYSSHVTQTHPVVEVPRTCAPPQRNRALRQAPATVSSRPPTCTFLRDSLRALSLFSLSLALALSRALSLSLSLLLLLLRPLYLAPRHASLPLTS